MTEGGRGLESGDITTFQFFSMGTYDPPQFLSITPLLIQTERESINDDSQEIPVIDTSILFSYKYSEKPTKICPIFLL